MRRYLPFLAVTLIAAALAFAVTTILVDDPDTTGDPSAPPTGTTAPAPTSTTRPKQDPGVAACRASAARQRERLAQGDDAPMPTEAQRRASWEQYQASGYSNLRGVGVDLEAAWTGGTLADQLAAVTRLVLVCSMHGVEVPT
jgi:hypothetical protein